jgi:hypothetical protein
MVLIQDFEIQTKEFEPGCGIQFLLHLLFFGLIFFNLSGTIPFDEHAEPNK